MNLKQWCQQAEKTGSMLSKEYFNFEVGLPYSKSKIKKLEKQSEKLSEYFLENFKEPEDLYDSCIGAVAGSKTYLLSMKLKEERDKKIITKKHKFQGKPVIWNTWRQFVVHATNEERKEVYDLFIKLAPKITPLIKQKFNKCEKIYAEYGTDPLTAFLQDHKLTVLQLKKILITLRNKVKKPFQKQFEYYSKTVLNKLPEYYDDLYYVRNAVFGDMTAGFKGIDPIKSVKKTMREMGLNPNKIKLDNADRPKKYASPFCQCILIPKDVRVSYKPENPLNDANSLYHEYGHAIHFSSIKKELPYWTRYLISEGLAETFSTFFEHLMSEYEYLTENLKLDSGYAKELIRRINFMKLFSDSFYTGNSLFRIAYWNEKLKFEECNARYSKEVYNSMGIKIPGAYWQLHHILPESLVYVPSYMLAEIQQYKIKRGLKQKYGIRWWKNKKAGKEIQRIMEQGADSPAADFSKITTKDINEYVKQITKKI